jgi:hypothetical protein
MAGGRPTKYNPKMCEVVIACGDEGMGKAEMAREIDVHHSTFIAWQAEHPEFSEAVKEAVARSQAWWEKKGRIATFDAQGFNATSFIFNMKNRFPDDWRDKTVVDQTVDMSVTASPSDELQRYIDGIAERRGKTS